MDLFTIAEENSHTLEDQFESLIFALAEADVEIMNRFFKRLEQKGRVAINMRQMGLLSFLTFGKYQNIYEWAQLQAGSSSRSKDEILRERLGEFYDKRVAFDDAFEEGEKFRYGALNIGGLGATHFGEFCIVFKENMFTANVKIAYLKSDSLKSYMLPGPAVDEDGVRRNAASRSHKQHLASLKNANEIAATLEDKWPSLVCSENEYVEAIFVGDVPSTSSDTIRMAKVDYDGLFQSAYEDFSRELEDAERFRIDAFVTILQQLEAHGITLEIVDNV